jgi:hypothetical protein
VTDAGIAVVAKHCSQLERLDITHTSVTNLCRDLGIGCPRMRVFSASSTDSSALDHTYWPKLRILELKSMVPTASLFAAFGRHNHELSLVQKPVVSAAFSTPLSKGRRLMTSIRVGLWEAKSVT